MLEEKIKAAKTVLGNEAASWFDIALAKANLTKAIKDFENQAESPSISSPTVPAGPTGPVGSGQSEDKKDEPKKNEEVEVTEDKTAEGTANTDKSAKTLKKDKRILNA